VLTCSPVAFYQEKQKRWTGSETDYAKSIRINPAEGTSILVFCSNQGLLITSHHVQNSEYVSTSNALKMTSTNTTMIVWNTHARVGKDVAQALIDELSSLTPPVTINSPLITVQTQPSEEPRPDLDTPDELASRALLLGIAHRVAGAFAPAREFLEDAHKRHKSAQINSWIGGLACYELAVLELKEADTTYGGGISVDTPPLGEKARSAWKMTLKSVGEKLDQAAALSGQSVDMSSRLDMRISLLRDELATKKEMVEV
jgi:hypothetical protein